MDLKVASSGLPTETSSVVLSVTPLNKQLRESLTGPDLREVFLELSKLRRTSTVSWIRKLRSYRSKAVIVTDGAENLKIFRPFLVLTALLIPAQERKIRWPDGMESPIGWRSVPAAVLRVLWGVALGQIALLRNCWYLCCQMPKSGLASPRMSSGRCLYLTPGLMLEPPIGGSIAHTSGIANATSRQGTEVKVVSVGEQPLIDADIKNRRVCRSSLVPFPPELDHLESHSRFFAVVEAETKNFQPDYFYLRYTLNDLTGPRLKHGDDKPLILEFNSPEVWQHRNWSAPLFYERIAGRIEKANLRSADLVVVVSDELRKRVLAAGVPEERVLFYPNCIDSRTFPPPHFDYESRLRIRQEFGVPADADLFTFVGTFGAWHGTRILAQAIRCLIDSHESWLREHRLHFLFVGDGVEREGIYGALGPDLGGPFVGLAGLQPHEKIPGILEASDILGVTPRSESRWESVLRKSHEALRIYGSRQTDSGFGSRSDRPGAPRLDAGCAESPLQQGG